MESEIMQTEVIATVVKMMEALPEPAQHRVLEHMQQYITELQDEMEWDTAFKKTQAQLVAAARQARKEIADGLAKSMDHDQL
jgi:uncharacterized iron-regulated protein